MKKYIAIIMVIIAFTALTGCSESKADNNNSEEKNTSISQNANTDENNISIPVNVTVEDVNNYDELLFGTNSAFEGIEMETDENGDIIMSNVDGVIRIKVIDKRFNSLQKLEKFAKNNFSGDAKKAIINAIDNYFTEIDGELYLVNGAGVRTISGSKKYTSSCYEEDCDMLLTISSVHTKECQKACGLVKSHLNFIRVQGAWLLDDIILYY